MPRPSGSLGGASSVAAAGRGWAAKARWWARAPHPSPLVVLARRACYGVLRFVMESGAKGCEVIVSGKLRAARAKAMKFKDGYMLASGERGGHFREGRRLCVCLRGGGFRCLRGAWRGKHRAVAP